MTDFFETLVACDPEPEAHSSRGRARISPRVNTLALDLGTHCGFALSTRDGLLEYGTEKFQPKRDPGERWSNFRAWLSKLIAERHIAVAYYEDVRRHTATDAAHVYGGFLAMLQMVCAQHRVRLEKVGVKQAKKAWTGNGNSGKEAMITTAQAKGFRVANDEDDTADALAILAYGVAQEA